MSVDERLKETTFTEFCSYAGCEVKVDTTVVLPSNFMPETPPRIIKRSCSSYADCILQDKTACPLAVGKLSGLAS